MERPNAASCDDHELTCCVSDDEGHAGRWRRMGEDYRTAARAAVVDVLATRMGRAIDRHLERMAGAARRIVATAATDGG